MSTVTRLLPLGLALAVLAAAPAAAQSKMQGIDTKFEKIEVVAGIRLIFCANGQSYQVKDNVYNFKKYKTLWVILDRRPDKIHIKVKDGFLKGISLGWKKTIHINTQILQTIRKLREGDRVKLNGDQYQFLRKSKSHLTLSPKLPGGKFGFAGESRIALGTIKTIEVVVGEDEDIGQANDELTVFGVVEGDTVELKLEGGKKYTGVVTKLSPINCDLLRWTAAGRYGSPKSLRRRDVTNVRHVPLKYSRSYPAGDGTLTLHVKRFRRAREGKTHWDVELSHDAPLSLLEPFFLTFSLVEEVGSTQTLFTETERVVQLFPNRKIKIKHTALNDRYLDGVIEVPKLKVLAYSSDEAEAAVLSAIDSGRNEDRLRGLYQGRLDSQDPAFLHLLLSRFMVPPVGRSGAEAHARLSEEMLRGSAEAGADAIIHEIQLRDDNYEISNLVDGELVRGPLPNDTTPTEWRRRLIALLKRQEGALTDGRAKLLFNFYCDNELYNVDAEKVFAEYPDVTVKELFGDAIPRKGTQPTNRQQLAATLIRNLKEAAFRPLGRALRKRDIDTTKFDAACAKYGSSKAEKATDVALTLAGETSHEDWLANLEGQVKAARKLAKGRKYNDALKALRVVLEQNPDFKSARRAFPSVAVKVASGMSSGGKACALLEEAVKFSNAAKTPLAALLLRGAKDDIDQIIVRDGPTHGGTVVHRIKSSEVLSGQREGDWVRVMVPGRKSPGYVHGKCVSPRGDGDFGASAANTPFGVVERVLKRVRLLSPDLAPEADALMGHLYARDGHALYVQGEYELAAPLLEKASELAPDDPLLAEASGNWLKANANLVLLVGIFLGVALIGGVMVAKRLKAEMAGEDLSGQNLEILLELGADEEFDDDDEDDEADFVFAHAGAHASA